jgi:carbonic anhydrase
MSGFSSDHIKSLASSFIVEIPMTISRRAILAALIACPVCSAARAAGGAHWSYEGADGPAKWADLDPANKVCGLGTAQSPIDLTSALKAELTALNLNWQPASYNVVNNGHTLQADALEGNGNLVLDGKTYALKQFHFHAPSEHTIDGVQTALEVHFVHASATGDLAVVGVLIKAGADNEAFATFMQAATKSSADKGEKAVLDANLFLPEKRTLFRYHGSLTTPPCSEVVTWTVFEEPIEVAQADIDKYRTVYVANARPVQPLNRRYLLRTAL